MLLGGCVYLRYLQVKRQLAEPERYLSLGKQSGLTLSFREPVLHPGDVLHVAKHLPSQRIEGRDETQWTYAFLKETRRGIYDSGPDNVPVDLFFQNGKLRRGRLPERFAEILDFDFVFQTLRAIGRARVDVRTRSVQCHVPGPELRKAALHCPSRSDLLHVLGTPLREMVTDSERRLVYRYLLKSGPSEAQKALSRSRAVFVFGTKDVSLLRAEFHFAGITLLLQYPPPTTARNRQDATAVWVGSVNHQNRCPGPGRFSPARTSRKHRVVKKRGLPGMPFFSPNLVLPR